MIVESPDSRGPLPLRTAELRLRAWDGEQIAEIAGLLISHRLGEIGEGTEAPAGFSPVFLAVTILTITGATGRAIRGGAVTPSRSGVEIG
jgi:hypothetical protein